MWQVHSESQQKLISDFYQKACCACFHVDLDDQYKPSAFHVVCKTCLGHIKQWSSGNQKSPRFAISMIWRKPKNHSHGRYFCSVNIARRKQKKCRSIDYPSHHSAIRTVLHSNNLPIPDFHEKFDGTS